MNTNPKLHTQVAQIRVDPEVKDAFLDYCRDQGMTFSEAIRALMARVLAGTIPLRETASPPRP